MATLEKAYESPEKSTTAISDLVKCPIKYVDIENLNTKITYKRDLFTVEQVIKYREVVRRTPNVKGKKILVFGGSGGIGSEVVSELKKLGGDVTAPNRELIDIENSKIISLYSFEKYDCIINCAGIYLKDEDIKDKNSFIRMLTTNLYFDFQLLEKAQQYHIPNVVLIGSTASSFGREGIGVYSASMSALNTLIEANVKKLKREGVNVNVICPAKVGTKLQTYFNSKADLSKMMKPKDVAKIIIGYCDVDFSGHIVYLKEGFDVNS